MDIPITDSAMVGKARYERIAADAYFTPAWVTAALLSRWTPPGLVWDPAAGVGHIVLALRAAGLRVEGSDLFHYQHIPEVHDIRHGQHCDFLSEETLTPSGLYSIVTNPPYDQAEAFIRRALELTRSKGGSGGSVAMLLRHEYDCAKKRRVLFEEPRFSRKITLTSRPRWFEGTTTSPRHNFAWFVWDARHRGPATLEWAP